MDYKYLSEEEQQQVLEGEITTVEREHFRLTARGEENSETAKKLEERHTDLLKLHRTKFGKRQ